MKNCGKYIGKKKAVRTIYLSFSFRLLRPSLYIYTVFCLGFKMEWTFVPSPLKMRGHFQNLRDINVYVV